MLKIRTATGKEFDCNVVTASKEPPRLYVYVVNAQAKEAALVFTDETELPLEGYPAYTAFDSMNMTPDGGINICLK